MMTYEAAKQLFDGAGLPLTESHFAQFQCYLAELTETNRHMNLTAITEPAEAWEKHFLDCAILLQKVQLPLGATCIDVGTGAGFPGMVLALLRPDLQVTLLDSLQKRIGFLEQTAAKLGLANVITLIVLVVYRPRDAFAVLILRILLGSIFTGTPVSLLYSLTGGILCFLGMALLCKLLQKKHLWFISIVGAVLHNVGQILAAIAAMQSVQVIAYFPFLLVAGCITGFFTGIAADRVIHFLPKSIFPKPAEKPAKNEKHS